jgi:hypothetical protein
MSNGKGGFIGQDGLNAPDEPTDVTSTAGNAQVSVAFTAPSDVGASAITGFRAQVAGIGTSGTSSPLVVTGLTNGTAYTANVWAINAFGASSPSDASGSFTPSAPPIGVVVGGQSQGMQFITIASTGNAADWGDTASGDRQLAASVSSATRGVYAGGGDAASQGSMEFITFASQGDAVDFGDTTSNGYGMGGMSNGTRGVFAGGAGNGSATLTFITISSTGNQSAFGTAIGGGTYQGSQCNSNTRGVFSHGYASGKSNQISYITIASAGNSIDFGDLTIARYEQGNGISGSAIRGVFSGGITADQTQVNVLDYITIASTGNATDFGNLTTSRGAAPCVVTNTLRTVFCGGDEYGGRVNVMDYITVTTAGNATDFGDLNPTRSQGTGMSQSHGGIA